MDPYIFVPFGMFGAFMLFAVIMTFVSYKCTKEQRNTVSHTPTIAVVGMTPYQPQRTAGIPYSEGVRSEILYNSTHHLPQQPPAYTIRSPPNELPPVFPDEQPPSYASVAPKERRQ